jgi:glycosyltransferase involved in cell wall biosynthesis
MPRIVVVIPTRNRGAQAVGAARAVLRDNGDFELVIVDQSTDDATEEALRAEIHDSRLRIIRSSLVGISNARNTGVMATSAPIVAFTDDDCRPEPGWASALLRVFVDEPETTLVFGRVHLLPDAHVNGYAASFEPSRRVVQGELPTPGAGFGIGANFAIRRPELERLGGFDPLLGTGAPFFSAGEELDLMVRALHAGCRVVNAAECDVLHLGLRTGADIRTLAVGYQIATGAALGKHARLAGLSGLRDVRRWASFYLGQAIADLAGLRRPRLGTPYYFIAGALLTLRYRIDHTHGVLRMRGRALTGRSGPPGSSQTPTVVVPGRS